MSPHLQHALQRIVRLTWEIHQADPHELDALLSMLEAEVASLRPLLATPTVVGAA